MAKLTRQQAEQLAANAGFVGEQIDIICSIAQAESSLVTNARNYNPSSNSTDRGILQINDRYHPEVSTSCADDPTCAFGEGYRISSAGADFSPWSTYTNGAYRRYLTGGSGSGGAGGVTAARKALVPNGTFISGWGDPRADGRSHQGEDLMAAYGSTFYAPENGAVSTGDGPNPDPLGGNVLYFHGDSGLHWYFAHLATPAQLTNGRRVKKGGGLGRIGTSGDADGGVPHLHYQVGPGGDWQDPAHVLANYPNLGSTSTTGTGGGGAKPTSITVYSEPGFAGHSHELTGDVKQVTVGLYFGGAGDIRSIRLHGGGSITLYGQINYAGPSVVVSHDVEDTADILPWFEAGLKVVSSIKFGGGVGTGGGGGLGGIYNFVNSQWLGAAHEVHKTLAHTPGFYGVALAIDEAEQLPGIIWFSTPPTTIAGDVTAALGLPQAGDIMRSVMATIADNTLGLVVRGILFTLGLLLLAGLIGQAVKPQVEEAAQLAPLAAL